VYRNIFVFWTEKNAYIYIQQFNDTDPLLSKYTCDYYSFDLAAIVSVVWLFGTCSTKFFYNYDLALVSILLVKYALWSIPTAPGFLFYNFELSCFSLYYIYLLKYIFILCV